MWLIKGTDLVSIIGVVDKDLERLCKLNSWSAVLRYSMTGDICWIY